MFKAAQHLPPPEYPTRDLAQVAILDDYLHRLGRVREVLSEYDSRAQAELVSLLGSPEASALLDVRKLLRHLHELEGSLLADGGMALQLAQRDSLEGPESLQNFNPPLPKELQALSPFALKHWLSGVCVCV